MSRLQFSSSVYLKAKTISVLVFFVLVAKKALKDPFISCLGSLELALCVLIALKGIASIYKYISVEKLIVVWLNRSVPSTMRELRRRQRSMMRFLLESYIHIRFSQCICNTHAVVHPLRSVVQ